MPPLNSRTLSRLRSGAAAPDEPKADGNIPPVIRDLEIAARPERVWAALTDSKHISAWLTCQDVIFEKRVGGRFRLFDGEATGTITRVEPPRLLEYTWQMEGWPDGAPPSLVRWDLSPVAGGKRARLRLTHTSLPDRATRDLHDSGWDTSFLNKLLPWLVSQR